MVCFVQQKREKAIAEGWEYARLAHLTYHITEHRLDFARRRRWMRKLINTKPGERAVFRCVCVCARACVRVTLPVSICSFLGRREKKKKDKDDDEEEDVKKQQVPRMYLTFNGASSLPTWFHACAKIFTHTN